MEELYTARVQYTVEVEVEVCGDNAEHAHKLAEMYVEQNIDSLTVQDAYAETQELEPLDVNDLTPDDVIVTDTEPVKDLSRVRVSGINEVEVRTLLSTSILTETDYHGADDELLRRCGIER